MNPLTHFFVSWIVGNADPESRRRDRIVVTLAGLAPDLDGLGVVPQVLTQNSSHPVYWYSDYHHVLAHNIGFALATTAVSFAFARRWKTAALALLSFHVHLLCDLAGSRGPDGYGWPIPYLLPFSNRWQLAWSGQWQLASWQNVVVTLAAMSASIVIAWRRGHSPVEVFSARGDAAYVFAIRDFAARHFGLRRAP
jgi:inner membrane protein